MKNKYFTLALMMSTSLFGHAQAALSEKEQEEILTMFDTMLIRDIETLKIEEDEGNINIYFPEVIIKNADQIPVEKIAPYTIKLSNNGTFRTFPQYNYITNEISVLKSFAHSYMLYSVNATYFSEEANIVPALGYKSDYKLDIKDLKFTETKDGLVSEVGKIDELRKQAKSTESQDGANYVEALQGKGLSFASQLFTISIQSFISKTAMKNVLLPSKTMETADEVTNLFKADNMLVQIAPIGVTVSYDSEAKMKLIANKHNNFDIASQIQIRKINLKSTLLPIDLAPKSIDFKLVAKDIDISLIKKELNAEAEIPYKNPDIENNEEETPNISEAQKSLIGKEIKYTFNAKFENGEVSGVGKVDFQKEDIVNILELTVLNFDTISPDNKIACKEQLATNPSAIPDICARIGFLDFLRPYINMSNRTTNTNGKTVDKFLFQKTPNETLINGQQMQ